ESPDGCIALLDQATPGVEGRHRQIVPGTEGSHTQSTALPLAYPAAPLLLFARIARSTVGHSNALLSEGITTWPSRTHFSGQTRPSTQVRISASPPWSGKNGPPISRPRNTVRGDSASVMVTNWLRWTRCRCREWTRTVMRSLVEVEESGATWPSNAPAGVDI